jgi:hypothetical protein
MERIRGRRFPTKMASALSGTIEASSSGASATGTERANISP